MLLHMGTQRNNANRERTRAARTLGSMDPKGLKSLVDLHTSLPKESPLASKIASAVASIHSRVCETGGCSARWKAEAEASRSVARDSYEES